MTTRTQHWCGATMVALDPTRPGALFCPECIKRRTSAPPATTKRSSSRLTVAERDAVIEAIGFRLAGEIDNDNADAIVVALESAQAKLLRGVR